MIMIRIRAPFLTTMSSRQSQGVNDIADLYPPSRKMEGLMGKTSAVF